MSFGTGLLYDILSDIMRSIVDHIGFLISDIYSYAVRNQIILSGKSQQHVHTQCCWEQHCVHWQLYYS